MARRSLFDRLVAAVSPRRGLERDRARAIAHAVSQAQAGDIVLIAGKGHEPYQEVHGVRHAFDDTVQARAALEARATLDRDLEARR